MRTRITVVLTNTTPDGYLGGIEDYLASANSEGSCNTVRFDATYPLH